MTNYRHLRAIAYTLSHYPVEIELDISDLILYNGDNGKFLKGIMDMIEKEPHKKILQLFSEDSKRMFTRVDIKIPGVSELDTANALIDLISEGYLIEDPHRASNGLRRFRISFNAELELDGLI